MLFQTLDNKKECYAIYCDGNLYHYPNSLDLTETWEYTCHFEDRDVEYAQIWCNGKSLTETCPEDLKEDWEKVLAQAKAFLTSFRKAKVSLNDVCFYDLVPKRFLIDYCRIKSEITKHVFENYKKPKNYDFYLDLIKLTNKIGSQNLNLDLDKLSMGNTIQRNLKTKLSKANRKIIYNPWGSITGRLTTKPSSFPILTLNKDYRNILKPKNDWFIELDYNAAELRTFLALQGIDQPEGDIHHWMGQNVFKGRFERSEVKKKVFAWLYNPVAKNEMLDNMFDKNKLVDNLYQDGMVTTPFGRNIKTEDAKALNYLIQSTTSDLFLRKVIEIDKLLEGKQSFVSYCIHDSLVLDFCDKDRDLLVGIIDNLSKTGLGTFKVNVSAGKHFGNMKKLEL